jgi:hypothetical protein
VRAHLPVTASSVRSSEAAFLCCFRSYQVASSVFRCWEDSLLVILCMGTTGTWIKIDVARTAVLLSSDMQSVPYACVSNHIRGQTLLDAVSATHLTVAYLDCWL